jgi:hypothetical protein
MSIEPVDPSKKTGGDGSEKYPAKPKHGPGEFDRILEKEKADLAREQVRKMSETTRSEPKYTGKAYSETGPTVGPRTSGGFGGVGGSVDPMERKLKPYNRAKGGVVKSASSRADGCAIRGKTRA